MKEKLDKTTWIDAVEEDSWIALRRITISGRTYLLIPKGFYMSRINDDLDLLIRDDTHPKE